VNIFILSEDPIIAAQMQCNKHVVKMTLETAQMLCAPFENGKAPYRRAHYNHPCTIWARTSKENYEWLVMHGLALCNEYTLRYGKRHASQDVIIWCSNNMSRLGLPSNGLTEFAVAISGDQECRKLPNFDRLSVKQKYRAYYLCDKKRFAKWTNRDVPEWWARWIRLGGV